jgi:hypothetical protein
VARALSDGAQSLNLDELAKLIKGLSAPIRSVAIEKPRLWQLAARTIL